MFTVNLLSEFKRVKTFLFQNISCLRLINRTKKEIEKIISFQNISCLRLICMGCSKEFNEFLFQNISCLRLIFAIMSIKIFIPYFKTFHVYG